MAVPDYESLMRPTLEALRDGSERTFRELCNAVAVAVGVSEEDRQVLLPSGRQTTTGSGGRLPTWRRPV